jgi:hypothetical protein
VSLEAFLPMVQSLILRRALSRASPFLFLSPFFLLSFQFYYTTSLRIFISFSSFFFLLSSSFFPSHFTLSDASRLYFLLSFSSVLLATLKVSVVFAYNYSSSSFALSVPHILYLHLYNILLRSSRSQCRPCRPY